MRRTILATLNIFILGPLSLLLLFLWVIFASSFLFAGHFQEFIAEVYEAVFVQQSLGLAVFMARELFAIFGGMVGWVSLIALVYYSRRPWSLIPQWVKLGCLVGAVAALVFPAAFGLGLPPVLLCASILWLAAKRDV